MDETLLVHSAKYLDILLIISALESFNSHHFHSHCNFSNVQFALLDKLGNPETDRSISNRFLKKNFLSMTATGSVVKISFLPLNLKIKLWWSLCIMIWKNVFRHIVLIMLPYYLWEKSTGCHRIRFWYWITLCTDT